MGLLEWRRGKRPLVVVVIALALAGACATEEEEPEVDTTSVDESIPMATTTGVPETTTIAPPATTATTAKPQALVATTARPAPTTAATSPPTTAGVYYANCDEARAAGAAPISRGEPGYRSALDRDGDGTACDK